MVHGELNIMTPPLLYRAVRRRARPPGGAGATPSARDAIQETFEI